MASFRLISVRFYTVFTVSILTNNFQLADKAEMSSRMMVSKDNETNVLYYLRQVTTSAAPQTTDAIVDKYRAPRTLANSGQKEIFLRDYGASSSASR
jgi:hypothetical protein